MLYEPAMKTFAPSTSRRMLPVAAEFARPRTALCPGRSAENACVWRIRQHTSAYVEFARPLTALCPGRSAENACVWRIRQHTSAYVSIRNDLPSSRGPSLRSARAGPRKTPVCGSYVRIRQHTSAYVMIFRVRAAPHGGSYVSIRNACVWLAAAAPSVTTTRSWRYCLNLYATD
jgi:hypothetical protein